MTSRTSTFQVSENNHHVMKASRIFPNRKPTILARQASKSSVVAVLVVVMGISWNMAIGQTQPPDGDAPGVEVLTRGPVHEAFAGIVTFNPGPGIVVAKAPPDVIEELPSEERPDGDNVSWIPGYWGWDDERSGFLWISGTWRALPPGPRMDCRLLGKNRARLPVDFGILG
jgi:hypothetical protein